MKCLMIINKKYPLRYQDKIVYFDTEDDTISFITACLEAHIAPFAILETQLILDSQINDNEYIHYKYVTIM